MIHAEEINSPNQIDPKKRVAEMRNGEALLLFLVPAVKRVLS